MSTNKQNIIEQSILEERIKASLENLPELDSETKRSLRKIRREALSQPNKTSWFKSNYWAPAAGLALCSVFAIMLTLPYIHTAPSVPVVDQTAMLELLDNPEELDALSDPGFYMWMDETQEMEKASNAA